MKFRFFILLTPSCMLLSCKRDVKFSRLESETFTKVIAESRNQNTDFLCKTGDGNFIVLGNDWYGDPVAKNPVLIIKFNSKGEILSKSRINDWVGYPKCRQLTDGSVIFNTSDQQKGPVNFGKLDANGNLVFNTIFWNDFNSIFGWPVQLKDGSYLVTHSNGKSTGSASRNEVALFKPDGTINKYFQIPDTDFGANVKILEFSVYKCDSIGTYYISGQCYENFTGWTNYDHFVAKLVYNGTSLVSRQLKIIDASDKDNEHWEYIPFSTRNGELIMMVNQQHITGIKKTRLIKIDENFNIVLEKDIIMGPRGSFVNNITECDDGSYIIAGRVEMIDKIAVQPFAAKMDANGQVIWSKIFNTMLSGTCIGGLELNDGSYIFAGHTNGYSKGQNDDDIFYIRTNKDRNIR